MVVVAPAKVGRGKKRAATDDVDGEAAAAGGDGVVKMAAAAAKDFGIEYAKSGRAVCRGCEDKILKDEVRVKKTSFDSEVGAKYGGQALWHHLECFAKLRAELGWFGAGSQLPDYKKLSAEDRKKVDEALP